MHGLIRTHYYKIAANLKLLSWILLFLGVLAVIGNAENTGLLTGFLCISIMGVTFMTAIRLRKHDTDKWDQYLLTMPIRRKAIVASTFLSQLMALCMGTAVALAVCFLSFWLHGFHFDRYVDVVLLFSSAIGVSLFMSAIFLPLSYLDGKNRIEAIAIISLLGGLGIVAGIIVLLNLLVEHPDNMQLMAFGLGIKFLAAIIYGLSYRLTAGIFSKR